MPTISKFEETEAWKTVRQLTNLIYDFTTQEKFSRDFGLRDQIRRAAVSVMSNIAEGFESQTQAQFIRFNRKTNMNLNWKRMKHIQKLHRVMYAIGFGPVIGKIILLLTTIGRKSGLKRVTPLQYEEIDGKYYLGSARGLNADWVRNIQSNPDVEVRVKSLNFKGQAEVVTDPSRFADFVEVRLQRHPLIVGAIMQKAHGLPKQPSREQLEKLAENEALVVITPVQISEN